MADSMQWSLERNARRAGFATSNHVDLFLQSHPVPARMTHGAQPFWKAIVGVGGDLEVGMGPCRSHRGGGVFVPPDSPHDSVLSAGHATLVVPAWLVAREAPRSLVALDRRTCCQLLEALQPDGSNPDIEAGLQVVQEVIGRPPALDARVWFALNNVATFSRIGDLAAEVELSPSRLRSLIQNSIGMPLVQVRHIAMLRSAIGRIDHGLARAATEGGFADQSHFTRVFRRFFGRSPRIVFPRSMRSEWSTCNTPVGRPDG